MKKLLTTAEFAQAIGASESSVRRWTNSGAIRTARTAGGHRRITLPEAVRFVRETGSAIARPEVLGLPKIPPFAAGRGLGINALEASLYDALCEGDAPAANGCVAGLFLNGLSVAAICDGAVQGAMKRIGQLWIDAPRGILIEHRATTICVQALGMLRQLLGDPAEGAPVALGAAPEGDPYFLPSMMAAAVSAEAGYREMNFGPDTPLDLLALAVQEQKPRLVWLAVKAPADRAKLRSRISELVERISAEDAHLVLGGGGVPALGLRSTRRLHIIQSMTELAAFARGVSATAGHTPPSPAQTRSTHDSIAST